MTEATSDKSENTEAPVAAISDLEREWIDKIKRLNEACTDAASAMAIAKDAAKAATEEYNGAVSLLRSTIRRGLNTQPELPGFDASADPAQEEQSWRDAPIREAIRATKKQAEKLVEAGVLSVGQFEDLRAGKNKHYPDGLIAIRGIGEATADKWEKEILDWRSQWDRKSGE